MTDKTKRLLRLFFFLTFLVAGLFTAPSALADSEPPVIDVWYGSEQNFGHLGTAQTWINILGNVSDNDGVATLSYSLNGRPEQPLSIGPDIHRLAEPGDFNIDIPISELQDGRNEVIIFATDMARNQAEEGVTINYTANQQWPESYQIDWSTVSEIADAAQVIDGHWELTDSGIRPVTLGYDRLVTLGDINWQNYEVTVPVTIHGAEPRFKYPSNGAMVGVVVRWRGHQVWDDTQPAIGWWPLGAIGAINWLNGKGERQVRFVGNKVLPMMFDNSNRQLENDVPYMFKLRVETIPGRTNLYSFKVWEASMPEPEAWDLKGQQQMWNPLYGSVILVAHHTDVSFGNVTITPLQARSAWEWFTLLGPYLAQLPLLLACLIGFIFLWRKRAAFPRLVLLAPILLALEALTGLVIDRQLPIFLHRQAWGTHEIGLALVFSDAVRSAVVAVALLILIYAGLRWFQQREVLEG